MLRPALILAAHLIAILAPIFLGWGLSDLPAFFAQPARAGLILLIAVGAIAVLILRIDLDPLRTGTPATTVESRTLLALTACSILLLAFLPYADRHHILTIEGAAGQQHLQNALPWLGVLLCAVAGLVRILALRELGNHFSAYVTLQPSHQLIQTGVYSVIRHPLYLSLLLAGPGVALIFASHLVWPIAAAAAVFTADRIRLEEILLAQAFPSAFPAYRDSTSALLPFIL